MGNVLDRVAPGGLLLTALLRRSHGYRVGAHTFPSAYVDEHDLTRLVKEQWGDVDGAIEVPTLVQQPDHGYAGIVLAALRRPVSQRADVPMTRRDDPGRVVGRGGQGSGSLGPKWARNSWASLRRSGSGVTSMVPVASLRNS